MSGIKLKGTACRLRHKWGLDVDLERQGARYINKEDDREGIVPYFELASIMAATDDFTEKNQLGDMESFGL
ncbi:hypothetical protein Tco_1225264 [Tanacetum coccineum]